MSSTHIRNSNKARNEGGVWGVARMRTHPHGRCRRAKPSYGHSGSAQDAVGAFGNRDVFGPSDAPLAPQPTFFSGGLASNFQKMDNFRKEPFILIQFIGEPSGVVGSVSLIS